jgi:hypothetical protein
MLVMGTPDDKLIDKTFMATLLKYLIYITAFYYGLYTDVLHYLHKTERIQQVWDHELFNRKADYMNAAKTPCLSD